MAKSNNASIVVIVLLLVALAGAGLYIYDKEYNNDVTFKIGDAEISADVEGGN